MDEIEDIRNLLITMEIKMSELEAEFNKEELEFADNLHMEGMNLHELKLMLNEMMTLQLHIDMDLDTSIALGMEKDVNLNFPIIKSDAFRTVLNKNSLCRYLFNRGKD